MDPFLAIFFSVIFGLLLGSFANAFAWRFPRGESLLDPSHCTSCGTEIKGRHNIPIVAWLWLRGKCASCGAKISPRYIIIEALTGVLFGLIGWRVAALDMNLASEILALIGLLGFAFSGVVLSLIDIDTKTLPTRIIYPTLAFVVVFLGTASALEGDWWQLLRAAVSALALGLVYFILWFVRPGALGFGDVRLAFPLGFALGWFSVGSVILGFFLPFILACLYVLPKMIAKKATGKTAVALGPWMLLGAALTVVFGDIFLDFYLQVGGLK